MNNLSKRLPFLDDMMKLKQSHVYYMQVQVEMAAAVLNKADFVVFTGSAMTVEVIKFDRKFWKDNIQGKISFFHQVFPEIQSRKLLQKIENAELTCHCIGARARCVIGRSACSACFHLRCVKLKKVANPWMCIKCQSK